QKHSHTSGNHQELITNGLSWLAAHLNADGGWGDTVNSVSNISTTMLARAAFHIGGVVEQYAERLRRSENYLRERFGQTLAEQVEAVRARYGKDYTFSVPILMTCALARIVDLRAV